MLLASAASAQENAALVYSDATRPTSGAENAAFVWHPTDKELLAFQAARLDADARFLLLKRQRDAGLIDKATFELASEQHARASNAYFTLVDRGGQISAASANNYLTDLFLFTASPRSVGGPSVLSAALISRGEDGAIRVDADSLQTSLENRFQQLRGDIPIESDARPLNAYLDELKTSSTEAVDTSRGQDGFVSFQRAIEIATPVQQYQLTLMRASPWQLHLSLRTTPSQASVVFTTPSGYRADFTTNTSRTTMRGLVDYTVQKAGYKTIRASNLDLVNAVEGTFSCVLIPVADQQPAQACNIR
ncbi:MAG TPA: hypothetical protein VM240_01165 [Verrucomicrobiae bacterium]|nr:hypothetical protein [Verrucomicrobiae bacterium]